MSSTDENGYLKSTFIDKKIRLDDNFFDLLKKDTKFLIGIAKPFVKDIMEKKGVKYVELARLEELAILNAIPTAEGAIKLAIEETDITIYRSKVLVFGLGKVGLSLAWRLKMLGADCYAVTRNRSAFARGKDLGIKMLTYDNLRQYLESFNILFNTVPAKILNKDYISLLNDEALIIDLASAPGGTDFEAADKKGIKSILALGLPGKIAPKTAGEILGEIIPDLF